LPTKVLVALDCLGLPTKVLVALDCLPRSWLPWIAYQGLVCLGLPTKALVALDCLPKSLLDISPSDIINNLRTRNLVPRLVPSLHWACQSGNDTVVIEAREVACGGCISILELRFV